MSVTTVLSDEYEKHGQCDWYMLPTAFYPNNLMMAFQVDKYSAAYLFFKKPTVFMLQRGSPYLEDANEVITLAREIGLIDAQFRNGWLLQFNRFHAYTSQSETSHCSRAELDSSVKIVGFG